MADKFSEADLGRTVRYVLGGASKHSGEVRPGQITRVTADGAVNVLVAVGDFEDFPNQKAAKILVPALITNAKFDATRAPGTWHWPEKQKVAEVKPSDQKPEQK